MKLAILTLAYLSTLLIPHEVSGEVSVTSSILGLTGTILKMGFHMIEDRSEIALPISLQEKEKKILQRISLVDQKISNMGHMIDNAKLETVYEIVNVLTRTIKVELRFNDLLQYIDDIDYAYSQMQEYAFRRDSIDRSTLEDFARSVISHSGGSVKSTMERVHRFIVPRRKFLGHSTLVDLLASTQVRRFQNSIDRFLC
ncbi:hypothetical protein Trydic_g23862 [Trypoxylus dichotomus]